MVTDCSLDLLELTLYAVYVYLPTEKHSFGLHLNDVTSDYVQPVERQAFRLSELEDMELASIWVRLFSFAEGRGKSGQLCRIVGLLVAEHSPALRSSHRQSEYTSDIWSFDDGEDG